MEKDLDTLIEFFKKYTSDSFSKEELGEQGTEGGGGGGGSTSTTTGYPNVPKWNALYTIKRGKGNKLGLKGEKWSTELTRSLGNQIW